MYYLLIFQFTLKETILQIFLHISVPFASTWDEFLSLSVQILRLHRGKCFSVLDSYNCHLGSSP